MYGSMKTMTAYSPALNLTSRQHVIWDWNKKPLRLKSTPTTKTSGPYNKIKETGQAMKRELEQRDLETILPYIEVYGHWTNDETKLETELYMCLK